MKITKTLARKTTDSGFFFSTKDSEFNLGLCIEFIDAITGGFDSAMICRATLSTKDQKEKGYRKVIRTKYNRVSHKGKNFVVCNEEQEILDGAGIKDGQAFWIKIELA